MGEYIHSKQAQFSKSYTSCGIMEVHHLPDLPSAQTLFSIANAMYHKANPRPAAFVMWSDVVEGRASRGELLAEKLASLKSVEGKEIDFGQLIATRKTVNPKTGNVISMWVWTVDHDSMRKWYQDELANRIEDR